MNQHDDLLNTSITGVLMRQAIITLVAAVGFFWFQGSFAGLSAGFGGCGSIVMTGLLAWRMKQMERQFAKGGKVAATNIMLSVAPRFLLVVLWFWFGLAWLDLQAVPTIVGFALAYFGYLLSLYRVLRA